MLHRRTMILADMPENRDICPVTIFLALAIADGALCGVQCNADFTALVRSLEEGWASISYHETIGRLSLLRRTGNNCKTISSCPMKPSQLHKMMQAQVCRAGHQHTFTKLLHDVRLSAQIETRRKLQCNQVST